MQPGSDGDVSGRFLFDFVIFCFAIECLRYATEFVRLGFAPAACFGACMKRAEGNELISLKRSKQRMRNVLVVDMVYVVELRSRVGDPSCSASYGSLARWLAD